MPGAKRMRTRFQAGGGRFKFYRGGVIVPLCDMWGGGYSLYNFVQNEGGGEV